MNRTSCALVTGATGTIGPALVRYLFHNGYQVRVLLHSGPERGLLPAEAQSMYGDITDAASLNRIVKGVDVVFHLAAKLHINDPGPYLAADFERVNVRGTEHLVRAAAAANVSRFIYFSTINVYGSGGPGVTFSETSPAMPQTLYARTKLRAEQIALEEHPAATVLRLAAVYGPRMRGNYPLLVKALDRGMSVMLGNGQNRRTLVYLDDVARAAVTTAISPDAVGRIYNVTDGAVHSFDAIRRAMQRALGKSERMLYIPAGPVRGVLKIVNNLTGWAGLRLPLEPSIVDKLTEEMAVAGDRIQHELGFKPAYSLDKGWKAAIRDA